MLTKHKYTSYSYCTPHVIKDVKRKKKIVLIVLTIPKYTEGVTPTVEHMS